MGNGNDPALPAPGLRALVLCAGEGTRLRPLTLTRPKALVEVAGVPLAAHLLRWLRQFGVVDVAINLHYLPAAIPAALGDGSVFGMNIRYSYEEQLLGTAGAARRLASWFSGTFLVAYGDILTDVDLTPLIQMHRASGVLATLGLTKVDDPTRAGIVVTEPSGRVQRFVEKPSTAEVPALLDAQGTAWASGGIYVLEPAVLDLVPPDVPSDFGHDLFPQLLLQGAPVHALPLNGYLLDIGSLERLAQAEADARHGRVRLASTAGTVAGGPSA